MREKFRKRFLGWMFGIFAVLLSAAIASHFFYRPVNWEAYMILLAGVLASIVSYFSFSQRQEIEELRAFQELFTSFNQHYNSLNNDLNNICERCKKEGEILTGDDKNILYDYFNLCGEEYYFYKKGIIYDEVWKAWCHGINYFLQCKKKEVWIEEEKTQAPSYYGLTYQVIQDMVTQKNK